MPDQRLPPGSILRERYEIGERLGHNRASTTYAAVDLQSGSPCVIKELSVGEVVRRASGAESYDPEDFTKLIELFEREARILANLYHAGVPRLIEHFSLETDADTRLYTVQEHIEGRTLAALVASGRHFSEEKAVALCSDVADILSHLHRLSPPLIHRDIKPSNVILDDDGTVHLIDFGAVQNVMAAEEQDGKTIVGTFGYIPMEQYEARALPASDIYALGGTLVFLLSHLEPHRIQRRGMTLDFRPHVNVSEGFSRVIEKMIEPNWEERYQEADELLWELAQLGRRRVERRPAPRGWGVKVAAALFALLGTAIVAPFFFVEADAPQAEISRQDISREEETLTPIEPPEAAVLPPVAAVDGVLVVDICDHFRYVAQGWPMGRSVGQTSLPPLTAAPRESLILPPDFDLNRGPPLVRVPPARQRARHSYLLCLVRRGRRLDAPRRQEQQRGSDGRRPPVGEPRIWRGDGRIGARPGGHPTRRGRAGRPAIPALDVVQWSRRCQGDAGALLRHEPLPRGGLYRRASVRGFSIRIPGSRRSVS